MFKRCLITGCTGLAYFIFQITMVYANPDSGYLAYNNPATSSAPSTLTTFSYIFSLLLTFAVVVGLAYFTSKFLSRKHSLTLQGKSITIHDTVSLGLNKQLYLVEIGSKVLLLGVTDHNINNIQEITDEKFITELKEKNLKSELQIPQTFQNVFQQQIDTLRHMTGRFSGQREE